MHIRIAQTSRLENINTTIKQGVFFTIVALLIGFLLSYLAANSLTKQLLQLINTMQQIRQGRKNIRADEKGVMEVNQLSGEFNRMLDTIDKNEQKLEQTQEELRQDIKQRVKVEKEIRHLNENLESIVTKRTEELTIEKNRAEVANQSKSMFLANMSHELRTPLNAVLGFSQLMQADPTTSESQHANLTIINNSGEHLLSLINDVLEMSKIEAGRVVIESRAIDLGELVRDIIDMMQNRAEEKNLQLLFEQSSLFPRYISADAPKLRQIIINLLSNAVKFTDEGGVTLRLGVEEQEDKSLLKLICEVEDSGVGLSEEELQTIFKPFIQVGKTDKQTGTGLGLAITKQYVELMGGELKAVSEPAKGSLFSASMIVGTAGEDDIEKIMSTKGKVVGIEAGQAEFRILSVEDKRENQLLIVNLLQLAGFQVKAVENGEEAVAAYSEWQPHFIWMDRRMPVMDGLEATRQIRKMQGGSDVIIVALTASVFKEQMSEILDAGLDDFIRKPYKPEEIYECMAKHLGIRFIYEEDEQTADETITIELTAEALDSVSDSLLMELYAAVIELDVELSLTVIEKIKHEDPKLAIELMALIDMHNQQWRKTKDINDAFIQSYMTNPVAVFLKKQQQLLPHRYGEIFLTNRYGAMIATTGKLTTLTHAHKYWWQASFDDGHGRIFLDDRGFDASVKGYVLGIVIPVKVNNEIIGILKCNVNINGPLTDVVMEFNQRQYGKLQIARTGGLIVSEQGIAPLSM